MGLPDFLQQIRKASGYTQKDIAEILGVDRSTYAYYECGKTEPCIRSLKKLSALYGISVDNLVNCRLEASPASLSAPLAEDGAFTNFEVFRKLDYTGPAGTRKRSSDISAPMMTRILILS